MKLISGVAKSGKLRYAITKYIYPTLMTEDRIVYYSGEHTYSSLVDLLLKYHEHKTGCEITAEEFFKLIKGELVYVPMGRLIQDGEGEMIIIDNGGLTLEGVQELDSRIGEESSNHILVIRQIPFGPNNKRLSNIIYDDTEPIKFNTNLWIEEECKEC